MNKVCLVKTGTTAAKKEKKKKKNPSSPFFISAAANQASARDIPKESNKGTSILMSRLSNCLNMTRSVPRTTGKNLKCLPSYYK